MYKKLFSLIFIFPSVILALKDSQEFKRIMQERQKQEAGYVLPETIERIVHRVIEAIPVDYKPIEKVKFIAEQLKPLLSTSEFQDQALVGHVIEHFAQKITDEPKNLEDARIFVAAFLEVPPSVEWIKNRIATNKRAQTSVEELLDNAARDPNHQFNEIVPTLLQTGVAVNGRSQDGWTPLTAAVNNRNLFLVRLLLEHKADANLSRKISGTDSEKPLTIAERNYKVLKGLPGHEQQKKEYAEIIRLLEQHSAKA